MNSTLKSLLFWVVLFVVGVLIWNFSTKFQTHERTVLFSEFISWVDSGTVASVTITGNDISGVTKANERFHTYVPAQYDALGNKLIERGVQVDYAIHPVAGRMPGHMNVLLAEAKVPYEQLKGMDEIDPEFKQADVGLVVGANDVVNPAAETTPGAPIYGMPILHANRAHQVVFMKRSMRPGFAGIENELLYEPTTTLLFGDAKDSMGRLLAELKALTV